jgi:hypothetical protein
VSNIPNSTTIKVYTAVCGGRDELRTDIECFDFHPFFTLPVMQAKVFKVLYYHFVQEPISIWVDGNISIVVDPQKVVDLFLKDGADFGTWKHIGRDCIYDEMEAIEHIYGKKIGAMSQRQAMHYYSLGFPKHAGLAECNVIVRRDTPQVRAFCDKWWSEICGWGFRDQISFPYVRSLFPEVKINLVEGSAHKHDYFKTKNHIAGLQTD